MNPKKPIRAVQAFGRENKYVQRWRDDPRFRVKISLYRSLLLNAAYAAFHLGLAFVHRSFWFFSIAVYYLCLSVMRLFLLRYTRHHAPGERMLSEWYRYRACGIALSVMNVALTVMIFFMVHWGRTFHHHEITTITMATYTFTAFTIAIVNMVRYRRYNSPVFSASKAISLASACVSVITLESTMLTAFGGESMDPFVSKLMLSFSGGAVSVFIVGLSVYMIVQSAGKIKSLRNQRSKE